MSQRRNMTPIKATATPAFKKGKRETTHAPKGVSRAQVTGELTARQLELLKHLQAGTSVTDAAKLMGISRGSADKLLNSIGIRFGVHGVGECLRVAIERGYL